MNQEQIDLAFELQQLASAATIATMGLLNEQRDAESFREVATRAKRVEKLVDALGIVRQKAKRIAR